jgi:hypothetical protein
MARDYPACAAPAFKSSSTRAMKSYFLLFFRPATGLFTVLTTGFGAGFTAVALGTSPITDLTGQILKIGHFLQPTAIAIGQIVMRVPFVVAVGKSA